MGLPTAALRGGAAHVQCCQWGRLWGCKRAKVPVCKAARVQCCDCEAVSMRGPEHAKLGAWEAASVQGCSHAVLRACNAVSMQCWECARLEACNPVRTRGCKCARPCTRGVASLQCCERAILYARKAAGAPRCEHAMLLQVCKAASVQCCERAGVPVCVAPVSEQGDPPRWRGQGDPPLHQTQHPVHPPALLCWPRHHGLGWEKPFRLQFGAKSPTRGGLPILHRQRTNCMADTSGCGQPSCPTRGKSGHPPLPSPTASQ